MGDILGDIMSRDVGVVGWYGGYCDICLPKTPRLIVLSSMTVIDRQMIAG
jgi:hypothetical protein